MVREDKLQEAGFGKAAKDVVTIDDFHDMLTALKGYSSNGTMFLGSPKGIDYMLLAAWNISADMYQVNGTVKYGPIQPEYKEYLSTVSQWYREGLIDQDFMTRTHYYVDFGLFMNGSVMVMPHVFTFLDTFQKVGSGQDPNYRVRAVPYPKLHNGDTRYISAGTTDTELGGSSATISTQCEHPELLCRWYDYMFTDDGAMLANYGIENLSYRMVDGVPKYTELVTNNPDLPNMNDAISLYAVNASFVFKLDPDREITDDLLPEANEARYIWDKDWDRENGYGIMGITLTADEAAEYNRLKSDITTYVEEYSVRAITDPSALDSWDSFVSQIQSMNIDRCIAIEQAAVDRYFARVID